MARLISEIQVEDIHLPATPILDVFDTMNPDSCKFVACIILKISHLDGVLRQEISEAKINTISNSTNK